MPGTHDDGFDFRWPTGDRPASDFDISLPPQWPPRPLIASEPLPELLREDSTETLALAPVERIESLLRQLSRQTNALAVRLDELEERVRVEVVKESAQAEIRLARDMDKLIAIIELAIKQQRQPVSDLSEGATRDDLQFWVEMTARIASMQEATTAKLDNALALVLRRGRALAAVPDRARETGPA